MYKMGKHIIIINALFSKEHIKVAGASLSEERQRFSTGRSLEFDLKRYYFLTIKL